LSVFSKRGHWCPVYLQNQNKHILGVNANCKSLFIYCRRIQ
jgi:hypothetical protein